MNGDKDLTIKDEFLKICQEMRLRLMARMDTVDQCHFNNEEFWRLREKAGNLWSMARNGMIKKNELSEKTLARWKSELEHIDMDVGKMPSPYEMMKERWANVD